MLARDANGTIMRKIDSIPETWQIMRDEEMLGLARKQFDDRDEAHEKAAVADDPKESS